MRLITLSAAGDGFMNFMGDEFGHPEWIDAETYAHRQWHLPKIEHTRYRALLRFDNDMLNSLVNENPADFGKPVRLKQAWDNERIICFMRGNILFAFNFHELNPQPSFRFTIPHGKYTEIFSTDFPEYAGHGNLEAKGLEHFSQYYENNPFGSIELYLPPLSALVLKRS
jgi:1,4-alpha-glucan branching enzyme